MSQAPVPITIAEVTRRGWAMAASALAAANTERTLVAHRFVTPSEDSVHVDEEFGGDERTLTFLRVVIPTLAERLQASVVAVSVPWNLSAPDGQPSARRPLLALFSLLRDEPAQVQARELIRTGGEGPPWWSLGEHPVGVPDELLGVAAGLRI